MLLWGIREQTIDVDIKLDPEPPGVFEAIARLKEDLELNIELASPDDFIPSPPDWRQHSPWIATIGGVGYFHFDPRMQALAKLERGHEQDLNDCADMLNRGLVSVRDIRDCFTRIRQSIVRFPAIDAGEFERKVHRFLCEYEIRNRES